MAQTDVQLSELATQMKSTIQDHFVPTLEDMKHKFDDSMHDVTTWANEIHDAIEQVRTTLTDQVHKMIDDLHHRQEEVKTDVAACMALGQEYLDELHQADGSVHTLHEASAGHGTELHTGLTAVQELGHKVQDEVDHHLTDWMGAIDQTLGQADEHAGHIEQNFLHLGGELAHGVSEVTSQIGHAASAVTEQVSKSLEEFGSGLEHMNGDQHDHLLNQVGESIGGNVGGFVSVVGEFMHAGEEMHHLFDGGLSGVLDSVQEVGKVIDEIKPVIKMAEALL
jgi:methyl-accepting chemotaxis protein